MKADPKERDRQLVARIWQLAEPVIEAEAMELVEVQYRREPQGWVLRLYVDKEDGVTIDDCTTVNRVIGDLFDVADPIEHAYHLEVSSPGLDRPLRKYEHFEREVGNVIKVVTSIPFENRRKFKGILTGAESDAITLDCDGQSYSIPLAVVERASLRYFESKEREQRRR